MYVAHHMHPFPAHIAAETAFCSNVGLLNVVQWELPLQFLLSVVKWLHMQSKELQVKWRVRFERLETLPATVLGLHHPDHAGENYDKVRFQQITEAYNYLKKLAKYN